MKVQEHLKLLGMKVQDRVTGLKGVVVSISFDLYGCIQAIMAPEANAEGKVPESYWLDVTRLKVTGKKPVMKLPNYDKGYVADGCKGPADKPAFDRT